MLPHDVLSVVYRHANTRTRARLHATSRATRRDPLMPPPLRQGYAYGTGRYQGAYNSLAKRIDTLLKRCERDEFEFWEKLDDVKNLVEAGKEAYRKARGTAAVRVNLGIFRMVPALRGRTTVGREEFMDAVLAHATRETRRHEAAMRPCLTASNANVSRAKGRARRDAKQDTAFWHEPDPDARRARHADKIARRAARRLSARQ
jgi:hypothetical protein